MEKDLGPACFVDRAHGEDGPHVRELLFFFSKKADEVNFVCQGCQKVQKIPRKDATIASTFVCTCTQHTWVDWLQGIVHTGVFYLRDAIV